MSLESSTASTLRALKSHWGIRRLEIITPESCITQNTQIIFLSLNALIKDDNIKSSR